MRGHSVDTKFRKTPKTKVDFIFSIVISPIARSSSIRSR